ncbi:hypothetical protein COY95_04050 [Candidatus Woesearchaeota archaeon CG_4_10_14_0_8_um_filter_47_5]|nr:MAG: hypothetical protein COY95_04050 [Candidatus Woesearchaeota archaeon CG_4_10_14_0_8_um_filter_47_5]
MKAQSGFSIPPLAYIGVGALIGVVSLIITLTTGAKSMYLFLFLVAPGLIIYGIAKHYYEKYVIKGLREDVDRIKKEVEEHRQRVAGIDPDPHRRASPSEQSPNPYSNPSKRNHAQNNSPSGTHFNSQQHNQHPSQNPYQNQAPAQNQNFPQSPMNTPMNSSPPFNPSHNPSQNQPVQYPGQQNRPLPSQPPTQQPPYTPQNYPSPQPRAQPSYPNYQNTYPPGQHQPAMYNQQQVQKHQVYHHLNQAFQPTPVNQGYAPHHALPSQAQSMAPLPPSQNHVSPPHVSPMHPSHYPHRNPAQVPSPSFSSLPSPQPSPFSPSSHAHGGIACGSCGSVQGTESLFCSHCGNRL